MPEFVHRSRIPAAAARVFDWHERPDALTQLIPPWERVQVEQHPAGLAPGTRAVLLLRLGPFRIRWVAEHTAYEHRGAAGGCFRDVQVEGPFARWEHDHVVAADGPGASVLEDRVTWEVPGGRLAQLVARPLVTRRLRRTFTWRHAAVCRAVTT